VAELTPYHHTLNYRGTACAESCAACRWLMIHKRGGDRYYSDANYPLYKSDQMCEPMSERTVCTCEQDGQLCLSCSADLHSGPQWLERHVR
jgi:hypothetical protein